MKNRVTAVLLILFGAFQAAAQTPDSSAQILPEVEVHANFPAYLSALEQQRATNGVVHILNLDLPGRFPDLNPAEALQRLPGIAIQRSNGEGRFVHIRGADPSLTTTQLNGEQIVSPEGRNRFLQFDLLPVDQLRAVEVFKTNLPDQDGDAIGGSINLLTEKPRAGRPEWQAAVAGGWNPAANLPNVQAQASFSGYNLLINGSFWQDHRFTENLETLWQPVEVGGQDVLTVSDLELRGLQVSRRRTALSAEYDVPLSRDNDQLYFRAQFLDFEEQNLRQRLRYRPGKGLLSGPADTVFQAAIGRDISYNRETERFFAAQSGFSRAMPRLTLDGALAFSYGLESEPEGRSLDFKWSDVTLVPQRGGADFPQFEVLNGTAENYNAFVLNELETENDRSTDQSTTGKLNARFALPRAGDFLKFGVKVRLRHKKTTAAERIYDEYTGASEPPLSSLLDGGDHNFLDAHYRFGQGMDWDKTRTFIDAHYADFQLNETETALESTAGNFDVRESTGAAYALFSRQQGPWSWLAGARLELTQYDYRADQVDVQDNAVLRRPLAQRFKGQYAYLLPTLAFHYRPEKGLSWRAALSASYARPAFDQLAPYQLFNQLDDELLSGNPDLRPVFAWNADFSTEIKLHNGGALSAGVFGKRLDHFIYTQQSRDTILWNGVPRGVLKTAPFNGEGAWLAGLELGWQQRLLFLPGAWSGLGIFANYTYTWSRAQFEEEEGGGEAEESIRLPGQAAHTGNVALWYDRGRWSGRVALNFQSDFLLQAGEPEDAATQLIYGSNTQLDATLSFRVSPALLLFAEGLNLLNTPLQYFSGDEGHRSKYERYGAWGRVWGEGGL